MDRVVKTNIDPWEKNGWASDQTSDLAKATLLISGFMNSCDSNHGSGQTCEGYLPIITHYLFILNQFKEVGQSHISQLHRKRENK